MEYRHFDSDEEEIADVAARVELPTEVWELIFEQLSSRWLRSARLTCRNWNQIIRRSPRLMDKFLLTLSKDNFQEERRALREYLASGGSYRRAKFAFFEISGLNPNLKFLPALGVTLHTLCLEFSATEKLLTVLLRALPNLKRLDLKAKTNITFRKYAPKFRLQNLEELTIHHFPSPNLLNYCRQISPQLTVLKLADYINGSKYDQAIIAFLNSTTCRTLHELEVTVSKEIVSGLVGFENIRLKRLSVGSYDSGEDVARVVNLQPNLEELNVTTYTDIQLFNNIISSQTKLKKLAVMISSFSIQQTLSLRNLVNIVILTIKYDDVSDRPMLDLADCNIPNIRILSLVHCNVSSQVLSSLQQTHITDLTLKECYTDRLPDLTLLKSLNRLELDNVDYIRNLSLPTEASRASSVRWLQVDNSDDGDQLELFAAIFPNLERFEVVDSCLEDDVFNMLATLSPQLKELHFYKCRFEGCDLGRGIKQFGALQTLNVGCFSFEQKSIEKHLRGISDAVEVTFRDIWGDIWDDDYDF